MTIYIAKGKSYEYTQINDIPASAECVGMTIKSLCWGDGIIIDYKNAKHISVLFLDSGSVEVVQKSALEVGNIADGVMREYLNNKKRDEAIIEACRKQQKKLSERIKKAHRRIQSRCLNRKARLERALELYKDVVNVKGEYN